MQTTQSITAPRKMEIETNENSFLDTKFTEIKREDYQSVDKDFLDQEFRLKVGQFTLPEESTSQSVPFDENEHGYLERAFHIDENVLVCSQCVKRAMMLFEETFEKQDFIMSMYRSFFNNEMRRYYIIDKRYFLSDIYWFIEKKDFTKNHLTLAFIVNRLYYYYKILLIQYDKTPDVFSFISAPKNNPINRSHNRFLLDIYASSDPTNVERQIYSGVWAEKQLIKLIEEGYFPASYLNKFILPRWIQETGMSNGVLVLKKVVYCRFIVKKKLLRLISLSSKPVTRTIRL